MKHLNFSAADLKVWLKRGLIYCLGLFIMAIGVVFSVKSALGVSPVTCLANVTHNITKIGLGVCTTGTYCLYILVELLILRRDFKASMLLQIVASFFFGLLVTAATNLFAFLPAPESYPMRLLFLLISVPLVAFGVMLYLAPQILPTPGEGLSIAVSKKTGLPVASCKMITDCCMVLLSAATSLIWFRALVGVREGTLISALTVGFVMKRMMRVCQPWLLNFVERSSKLDQAIADADPVRAAAGLVIAICREAGSGGDEIARLLSEKLGLPVYDEELIPLEAQESGLGEDFVRAHQEEMNRGLVYDFLTAGYAMYNAELPPLERLFAAQTRILRNLAASDQGGIIMGRCGDYILRDSPNCLRIFLHAPSADRAARSAAESGETAEAALTRLRRTDAARKRFYRHFTGRDWGDTRWFDLTLDTSAFSDEGCTQLILEALRLRTQSE